MSLRARVRRLQVDMEWMRWWGRLRHVEQAMRMLEVQNAHEAKAAANARPSPGVPPAPPHPEKPRLARRLEEGGPAPPVVPVLRDAPRRAAPRDDEELVQPFVYDPPPHMQIRPVQWRTRTARDYADDEADTYGRCLTDYDVMASSYYDDD